MHWLLMNKLKRSISENQILIMLKLILSSEIYSNCKTSMSKKEIKLSSLAAIYLIIKNLNKLTRNKNFRMNIKIKKISFSSLKMSTKEIEPIKLIKTNPNNKKII